MSSLSFHQLKRINLFACVVALFLLSLPAFSFDDTSSRQYDWSKVYDKESRTPPDPVLLSYFGIIEKDPRMTTPHRYAVDLGCGEGKYETVLLKREWRVLAIDSSHAAIERVLKHPEADKFKLHLELREASMTETQWHDAAMILARNVLPYLSPREFPAVMNKVRNTLMPGGYFVGTLFGEKMDNDESLPPATKFSKVKAATLFKGYELLKMQEVQFDQANDAGKSTHYDLIYFLARRPTHG